ncbi:hypothetical protein KSS87_000880, partial [Heliosperma pusillum]
MSMRFTGFIPNNPSNLRTYYYYSLTFINPSLSFFLNSSRSTHSSSDFDTLEGLIDPNQFPETPSPTFTTQDYSFLKTRFSGPKDSHFPPGKSSDDAVAIFISSCINQNGSVFDLNTQKCLRKFRDKLTESLVINVLRLVKNPQLGVEFFMWAGQQVGYSHTNLVYDALLDVMGCGQNVRVPDELLREIRDDDTEVLGKVLNFLVRKCCRNGMWNVALEELGRLKDFGYKPSKGTYNALVRLFLEGGRLDTAQILYREMVNGGMRLDISTLNYFVNALCKEGKWREALDLIEKEEFVPDTKLYTTMISGLCEASLFDVAMDFLNKMRCTSSLPNALTYRTLLCGCLNKKRLRKCKRILGMMMDEGCYPNRRIFNSLVHAYCASGDYSYAYKLLKKMTDSDCKPCYLVYNILIGGICGKSELPSSVELELAEKAYTQMLNLGLVLNKVNVSNFSRCLCEAGKFEKAYNVIQEMITKGFVPDNNTYTNVIESLCNRSQVEKAFQLFEQMKGFGGVPNVYTYTILIDGFCKVGLIVQARKWFNEMIGNGCSPNVVTYTVLVHAYLKVRRIDDANELFEMMLSNGCSPNVVTYTALIDGHCKSGNIDKACQIYARMRGDKNLPDVDMYFKQSHTEVSLPNVFTYGALVDGLCKAHKVSDAHNLLVMMSTDGCEPNHIVYDALIDGFCKAGELDKAQDIYTNMIERGYIPNEYTYGALIDRLFKDKRLDLALKLLSKMLENNCAPNVVIYTEMVDGLCKSQKTEEAYKLFLMMDEKGCHPNVVTYTAMIDGFGKAGKINKCLELFKAMTEKGCAPNYVTYRVMINHCCRFGLLDKAHHLLEEMKQTHWPMHVASYKKVVEGFNNEFIISLGLLDILSNSEQLPIVPVYKILVDSFCRAGRLEMAVQLCKELSSFASLPTVTELFSSTINCLSLASKIDEACELFSDMTRNGGVPEPSIFFNLITGLVRVDLWGEALQILHSTDQMAKGNTSHVKFCGLCNDPTHPTDGCPSLFEEEGNEAVNALGSYGQNQRRNDPFSNTYNAGTKNHPNFKWDQSGNNNQRGPSNSSFTKPRQHQRENSTPPSKSLEDLVTSLALNQAEFQKSTQQFQTSTQQFQVSIQQHNQLTDSRLLNLETQVGQILNVVSQQPNQGGRLPSQTIPPPTEQAQAISLRNGRELEELPKPPKKSRPPQIVHEIDDIVEEEIE